MNKRLFSGVGSSWITSRIAAVRVETGEVIKVITIFRPFFPRRAQEQKKEEDETKKKKTRQMLIYKKKEEKKIPALSRTSSQDESSRVEWSRSQSPGGCSIQSQQQMIFQRRGNIVHIFCVLLLRGDAR